MDDDGNWVKHCDYKTESGMRVTSYKWVDVDRAGRNVAFALGLVAGWVAGWHGHRYSMRGYFESYAGKEALRAAGMWRDEEGKATDE